MPVEVTRLEDAIFQLGIVDPASKNALTDECIQELIQATQRLRDEPGLKVLLVTGLPDIFCSGAPRERLRRAAAGEGAPTDDTYWPLLDAVTGFPFPVVAALEGHAIGGGLMLAMLLADVVVAADTARYGLNFSTLGFTPGMGATVVLPRLVGPAFAAEMLFGGKLFTGAELRYRGLFNHIVPRTEVRKVALDLVRRIADRPRYVLQLLKATLAEDRRRGLHAALERECALQAYCLSQEETAVAIETMYLI